MANPGDKPLLEVWRGGKRVELQATLGSVNDKVAAASGSGAEDPGRLGVAVRPLSPEEREALPDGLALMGKAVLQFGLLGIAQAINNFNKR